MRFNMLQSENLLWSRRPQKLKSAGLLPRYPELQKAFVSENRDFVTEMLPDLSPGFLMGSIRWVSRILKIMTAHTWVTGAAHLEKLQALDATHSIVLVANHRSNADYMFLPLLINRLGLSHIHILGNSKLNIFPFGWFFKKWGAYFVRQGEKNRQYYDLLKSWASYLLEHGYNTLVFPEGGLSQDGHLRHPKTGFLKTLLESPHADKMIVVPLMFAYDWIPEDMNLSSKRGYKPEHWTYWKKIKMLKFFRNYGDLYCRIYEPIRVSEWLNPETRDLPEQLLDQVFSRFKTDPVLSPSAILASCVLRFPQASQDQLKKEFVNVCQQYSAQLTFADFENKFEIQFRVFKNRSILAQENILRFYANQLETQQEK